MAKKKTSISSFPRAPFVKKMTVSTKTRYAFKGDGTPTEITGEGGATTNKYRGRLRGGPIKSKPIIQ